MVAYAAAVTNSRFALFDSLRALAALGVLVFHAGTSSMVNATAWYGGLTSHLNVGVALFFLISGFLLYRPYAQAILDGSALPSTRRYARHRALRIAPAYWVALTLLAIWPGLAGVFTSQWWVFYCFLQSYRLAWVLYGGIPPAWSLSVEVAFYALLPLLAWALAGLCRGRSTREGVRLQLVVFTSLGVIGIVFRYTVQRAELKDLYTTLPSFLAWFATGMSTAVVSVWFAQREDGQRWTRYLNAHPTVCWILALAIYLGVAVTPAFPRPYDGRDYTPLANTVEHVLYTVIALLIMLPAIFGETAGGWPRRLLASRALTAIGVVSYGVFLWHWALLIVLSQRGALGLVPGWPLLSLLLVAVPLTFACAWLSYWLIERPALRLGARSR